METKKNIAKFESELTAEELKQLKGGHTHMEESIHDFDFDQARMCRLGCLVSCLPGCTWTQR